MPSCSVTGCTNNSRHQKERGFNFHTFPKDGSIAIASKWRSVCKKSDCNRPKPALVCSEHFEDSAYERDLQAELLNYVPRYRRLRADAVPTLKVILPKSQPVKKAGRKRGPTKNEANSPPKKRPYKKKTQKQENKTKTVASCSPENSPQMVRVPKPPPGTRAPRKQLLKPATTATTSAKKLDHQIIIIDPSYHDHSYVASVAPTSPICFLQSLDEPWMSLDTTMEPDVEVYEVCEPEPDNATKGERELQIAMEPDLELDDLCELDEPGITVVPDIEFYDVCEPGPANAKRCDRKLQIAIPKLELELQDNDSRNQNKNTKILKQIIREQSDTIQKLNSKIQDCHKSSEILQQEIITHRNTIYTLQCEVQIYGARYTKLGDDSKNQIEALQVAVQTQENNLNVIKKKKIRQREVIRILESEVKAHVANTEKLTQTTQNLRESIGLLQSEIVKYGKQMKHYTDVIKVQRETILQSKSEMKSLNQTVSALKKDGSPLKIAICPENAANAQKGKLGKAPVGFTDADAISLWSLSPRAYDFMRSKLHLPEVSTLREMARKKPGVLDKVLDTRYFETFNSMKNNQ